MVFQPFTNPSAFHFSVLAEAQTIRYKDFARPELNAKQDADGGKPAMAAAHAAAIEAFVAAEGHKTRQARALLRREAIRAVTLAPDANVAAARATLAATQASVDATDQGACKSSIRSDNGAHKHMQGGLTWAGASGMGAVAMDMGIDTLTGSENCKSGDTVCHLAPQTEAGKLMEASVGCCKQLQVLIVRAGFPNECTPFD